MLLEHKRRYFESQWGPNDFQHLDKKDRELFLFKGERNKEIWNKRVNDGRIAVTEDHTESASTELSKKYPQILIGISSTQLPHLACRFNKKNCIS